MQQYVRAPASPCECRPGWHDHVVGLLLPSHPLPCTVYRYIFPGVGLGASVCATETIPDSMLYHAAVALSRMTTTEELEAGRVFPALGGIRDVSLQVCASA